MRRSDYPAFVVLAALMVGLLIGWLLVGWWLWPVQWTDALPADLAPEYRHTYVIGVAYMYQATHDLERAQRALAELGPAEQQSRALAEAMAASPADAQVVRGLRQALALPEVGGKAAGPSGATSWLSLLLRSLLVVLVVGLGGLGGLVLYNRVREEQVVLPRWQWPDRLGSRLREWVNRSLPERRRGAEATPDEEIDRIGFFTATFRQGISDYTESYNLLSPDSADYLGECGMGVRETLDNDDQRVTALEVWLFDKKDIITRACVLLSQYAYEDPARQSRLTAQDAGVLAEPGATFTIESQSMVLFARVRSVEYAADDDAPPQSVFKKVEVEMDVRLRE